MMIVQPFDTSSLDAPANCGVVSKMVPKPEVDTVTAAVTNPAGKEICAERGH
jgi:hypothetical protein